MDGLPEDANIAFVNFVRIAQRRLADQTAKLEKNEEWSALTDARLGFVNIVVAAAKRFGIDPFASMEVPRIERFNDDDHRQFKADLDHYMTQLLLDNSIRGKGDSVSIAPKVKDRIAAHIHGLRTCVENSNLSDSKKSKLNDRLDEFEKELEKRKLNLLAVTRVTLEIFALPGAVWASVDMTNKLITNVLQEVGEAKIAEDETRELPSTVPPSILSPPRVEAKPTKEEDLDDEIPF